MSNNQQNAANSIQHKNNASGGELSQKQIEKQQRKEALIIKSRQAKKLKNEMVQVAETADERMQAALLTVNQVLVMMYETETAAHDFRTFQDWKKDGYSVKKNEKGFAVWGTPKRTKKTIETDEGEKLEGDEFSFYPVCYLFNENQVSKMGGDGDDKPRQETAKVEQEENKSEAAQENTDNTDKNTANLLSFTGPSPFIRKDLEERREGLRAHLEDRARAKAKESDAHYKKSQNLVSGIEMGQPILVGHHSERRHRRALDRSWSALGKSVEASSQAKKLEQKAKRIGTGGVSINDPEAVTKLKRKLQDLEKAQEIMKAANKALKNNDDQAMLDLGLPPEQIEDLKAGDFAGRKGFAPYALQNNNAEIRRVKQRIEELAALYNAEPIVFENDDFAIDVDNGQIVLEFQHGKPTDEVRAILKGKAFKWSRSRKAWVRKVTLNALAEGKRLIDTLKEIDDLY